MYLCRVRAVVSPVVFFLFGPLLSSFDAGIAEACRVLSAYDGNVSISLSSIGASGSEGCHLRQKGGVRGFGEFPNVFRDHVVSWPHHSSVVFTFLCISRSVATIASSE